MNKYAVAWRGQTYYLHDITIDTKNKYVEWAKEHLTQEGQKHLAKRPDLLNSYLLKTFAEIWWGDGVMSEPLWALMKSPVGHIQLNRLLFGDSAKVLSDADLSALIAEKDKEQDAADEKAKAAGLEPPYPPVNDYAVGMQRVRENADPKAKAAATGPDPPGG